MLRPLSDLPRLAHGRKRRRLRSRRQAFSLAACLPGLAGNHLHRLDLCVGLGIMATHGFRSRKYHSARPGKWQCKERGRRHGHGTRLVWLRVIDYCDDWIAGYDTEYADSARNDGLMRWAERRASLAFFLVFILFGPSPGRDKGPFSALDYLRSADGQVIPICRIFSVAYGMVY